MLAYICDRCGKTIPRPKDGPPIKRVIDWGAASYDDPTDGGTVEQIDVCESCLNDFLSWKTMYHNKRLEDE